MKSGDGVSVPPSARRLSCGEGWTVSEVICTLGPHDKPFEERHASTSVAIVLDGTFQYRARNGSELLTPGALLLGSSGQCFECCHEHGTGDTCISIAYTPDLFERLAYEVGEDRTGTGFKALRVPPLRTISPFVAAASAAISNDTGTSWDELSIQLAAKAIQLDRGTSPLQRTEPGALGKIAQIIRTMERYPDGANDLSTLAKEARLSVYHFLRTFQIVTGVTPHQYLMRVRLRQAALRLRSESTKIIDLALDCGFGDVSNFVRAFRAEFGVSPRSYRGQQKAPLANQRGF